MRAATFNLFHHLPFKCKKIAWSVICIKRPPDRRPPLLISKSPFLAFLQVVCVLECLLKNTVEESEWDTLAIHFLALRLKSTFYVTSEIHFLRYVWNPLFNATPEICFLPRCTYKRGFIWYTLSVILISNTMSGWILPQKYETQKSMKVCDPKVHIKVCNLKSMCGMKSHLEF